MGALVLLTNHAEAQSQFTFSITGNPSYDGGVASTVYGLLTLDATETVATDLIATLVPGNVSSPAPSGFNFAAPSEALIFNSFTVSNGQVTQAEFVFYDPFDSQFWFALNFGGLNLFGETSVVGNGSPYVQNNDGVASLNFTPVTAPEPTTLALVVLGLGSLMLARRRQSK